MNSARPSGWYCSRLKRIGDLIGASVGLVLAAPLIIVIAAAIRLTLGRPVLFLQERPGLNERSFMCVKFRTMRDTRDAMGHLLPDEKRVSGIGRFLRRYSMDELPQLWNILRGDMSFVGPRPLIKSYLRYYTKTERRRHRVRPGLTGWAQIHGRNSLSFDKRLELDVWYVDHLSWQLDLRILAITVWIVLTQIGFQADSAALNELRANADYHTPGVDQTARGPLHRIGDSR